jgi:hypothetical protein
MDEYLNRIWSRGKTPYSKAFGLFLIVLLVELGLVSTISGIGFSTEIENYRKLVWIASVSIALLVAIFWLWFYFRKPRIKIFLRNAQDDKIYLKDLYGKAREVPDLETYSFLTVALNASEIPLDTPSKEIDKLRGEKLVSIKKWERPLTSDEKTEMELWYKVNRELEKIKVSFVSNTSPQKIVIEIANRGKSIIHIKSIKFQHRKLSQESFPDSYTKIDGSYVGIPFSENKASLEKGQSIQVELELKQKWQRPDIEKILGELGFLLFDVLYEGKSVNRIIITI